MRSKTLAYFAWFVLAYTVAVILWGAYVRATGSGAGCGNHWPLCNGVVVPRAEQIETLIEFTHRLMTGILLPLVIGLAFWIFRRFERGEQARLGAVLALVFLFIESLLGAGLVRFELVAENSSGARAFAVSIHLVNTYFLLASLTLTGWWVSGGRRVTIAGSGWRGWLIGLSLLGLIAVGATGAITALGDTLFPSATLAEGLAQDLSRTAHFLIRLRVIHPLLAILFGIFTAGSALSLGPIFGDEQLNRNAFAVTSLVVVQLGLGVTNILLQAPLWLQMAHLLVADLVWISMILIGARTLGIYGEQTKVHESSPLEPSNVSLV